MKETILAICLVIIYTTASFSQTEFKKGYVVKINGDTLQGFVNFRKEAQNYTECNFKRFQIAFPVNYSAEKIKAYGIDGSKQYISAKLNGQTIFVEYLVRGKISLLYYKKGMQHFYIKDQDGIIVELESGKTTNPKTNQTFDHYKDYLLNTMNTVSLNEEIQDSKMELGSLIQIVKRYNELSNASFEIPQRPAEKSIFKDYSILGTKRLKIGLVGGSTLFKFSGPTDSKYDYIGKANFNKVSSPLFGLFVSGNITKFIPNLGFKSEVLFHKSSLYGFSTYDGTGYYSEVHYNELYFNYNNLNLHGTVNYSINLNKIKIVPHFGLGYKFYMNSSYYRFSQIYSTANNIVKTYEYSDLAFSEPTMVYIGGISFDYELFSARIISVTLDYITGNVAIQQITSNNSSTLYGKGTSLNFTIGLTL